MENLYFNDETIRQYVMGDLEGQTLIDFEKELNQNEDLKAEVELFAFLIADANLEKKKHFKTLTPLDTVFELPKEEESNIEQKSITYKDEKERTLVEEPKKTYPMWSSLRRFAAAAILIAALGIGWFVFNNGQGTNNGQLADRYLTEIYAAPTVVRGEGEDTDALWNKAVTAYKESKFDKSAGLIKQVIQKGKNKDVQQFYLGLSYLYQTESKPEKAIKSFAKVKEGYYFESAQWYESLAHLKLNNKVEAKKLLEGLKNSNRKVEVEKLLKGL